MQFDDIFPYAIEVDRAYHRLETITGKTSWDAVRRGGVSDEDRRELRLALEQAQEVVSRIAGNSDLWDEFWAKPKGMSDDARTRLGDEVQRFRRALNGLCGILTSGQRLSWVGSLDLLDVASPSTPSHGAMTEEQQIEELRNDLLSWTETARVAIESADLFSEFRAAKAGTAHLQFLGGLTLAGAALTLTLMTGGAAAPFLGVGQVVVGGAANAGYQRVKRHRDRKKRIDHFEEALTSTERGPLLNAIGKWTGKVDSLRAAREDGDAVDQIVEDLEQACDLLLAHRNAIAFFEQLDANFERGASRKDARDYSRRALAIVESLAGAVGQLGRAERGRATDDQEQWERLVGHVEALFDELADILCD